VQVSNKKDAHTGLLLNNMFRPKGDVLWSQITFAIALSALRRPLLFRQSSVFDFDLQIKFHGRIFV